MAICITIYPRNRNKSDYQTSMMCLKCLITLPAITQKRQYTAATRYPMGDKPMICSSSQMCLFSLSDGGRMIKKRAKSEKRRVSQTIVRSNAKEKVEANEYDDAINAQMLFASVLMLLITIPSRRLFFWDGECTLSYVNLRDKIDNQRYAVQTLCLLCPYAMGCIVLPIQFNSIFAISELLSECKHYIRSQNNNDEIERNIKHTASSHLCVWLKSAELI